MGVEQHNYLIVSSSDAKKLEDAHFNAKRFFGTLVSPIIKSMRNDHAQFFVGSSGSKAGWAAYDQHIGAMAGFIIANKGSVCILSISNGEQGTFIEEKI